jgi:seryl-tRNA synthetase
VSILEVDKVASRRSSEPDRLEAIAATLFRPLDADGLFARTELYESVVEALGELISRHRPANAEVLRFPPVMSRRSLESSGYHKSFPNLLGCVCCLGSADPASADTAQRLDAGEAWTDGLTVADLVLTPAACYPVYPLAAKQGVVPGQGYIFDVACDCFRREPSRDIDRLQSFRMREYVRIGTPEQIKHFRESWIEQAKLITSELQLPFRIELASDPFFGRTAPLMAAIQTENALKFELQIPILGEDRPTACMSFNYHRDHFGRIWGLAGDDGAVAHTGCVAFGMDRLAIALFATHGVRLKAWPKAVRALLAV